MIKVLLATLLVFSILLGIDDVKAKEFELNQKQINFDTALIAHDDDGDDDWDSDDEDLDYIFDAKKDKDKKSKKKKKKKDKKKS
jgi:hypothetical protein